MHDTAIKLLPPGDHCAILHAANAADSSSMSTKSKRPDSVRRLLSGKMQDTTIAYITCVSIK